MNKHTFKAQPRQLTGRSSKKLRSQGLVPANVFGKKIPSFNIQVNSKEFLALFRQAGESTLVYLQVEGEKEPRPVLIRDLTKHPVTGQLLHVSFHQVDLKEKVTAPVAIHLSGESLAEKDKLGILVQHLHEVEIEALPADMPEDIKVDVSHLSSVDESIHVKDLKLGSKLTIKTDSEAIIVKIEPLAKEEIVEKPAVPVEGEPTPAAPEGQEPTAPEKPVEPKAEEK